MRIHLLHGLLPLVLSLAGGVLLSGCAEEGPVVLPSATEVESYYIYPQGLEALVEGTIVEIRAVQPTEHLERGGRLWARAGPYVLLFSEETRSLLQDHPDLTAVRVVTVTPEGEQIAGAELHRDALTGTLWRRSMNIAGRARREGTKRPTVLEELVRWGEEHTDYEYAPRFQETG
ncbi:MAG: hypothetical protein R3223_06085 [Longimicrobiales bacterium]|nr:hypothetical protein [Longimicrobiales bacterium]